MRAAILGAGYVGACTAAVLAEQGHQVIVADPDKERVMALAAGRAPVYEPGLDDALAMARASGRLSATTSTADAVDASDVTLLCVGTPPKPDGSQDLKFLKAASQQVGQALRSKPWHCVIVKSTVLPGTTEDVVAREVAKASGLQAGEGFGVAVNPEFLREGSALSDARAPDRIVVGQLDEASGKAAWALWEGLPGKRLTTDLATAELIKVASNAFLAAKVGLANDVANVAAAVGVDAAKVMEGVGLDARIGPQFLRFGAGFGGSCFPKDVRALVSLGKRVKKPSRILAAVLEANDAQPLEAVRLAREALGTLKGKRIALLGLAFKPDTDDVRETRALPLWQALTKAGATVICFDPRASENFRKLAPKAKLAASALDALEGADCAIVQAEWSEFRALAPAEFKRRMRRPLVVDARRALDAARLRGGGVEYRAIGLGERQV